MKKFTISGKVWKYAGEGAWYFVYVNEKLSRQIKDTARNEAIRANTADLRDSSKPHNPTSLKLRRVPSPSSPSQATKYMAKEKKKVGFHFVRIQAQIGKTSWKTALFPTKDGPYLIAIKADVRRKEGIDEGDSVSILCNVL